MLASQGVKKTQAEKALANLAGRGDIVCKEFGKTKIYFPSQADYQEMGSDVCVCAADEQLLSRHVKLIGIDFLFLQEQAAIRKNIQTLSEDVKEQASRVRELQQGRCADHITFTP